MSLPAWSWASPWAALPLRRSPLWASSSRSLLTYIFLANHSKPAQRHVHVRFTRSAGTTGGVEMADRRGASPVRGGILFFHRTENFVVVRGTSAGRGTLQCARFWMERPLSLRRADSSELLARFRLEQLAEQRAATAVADFLVWRDVCHALAHFRRGDGHRAGPVDWQANDGDRNWESARQILDCCFFVH